MESIILAEKNRNFLKELLIQLKDSELRHRLTPNELDILVKHSKMSEFLPGEFILQQGKKAENIYLIMEGYVHVNARIMGQGASNINLLGPGCFFGEICLLGEEAYPTSVIAKTTVICLIINSFYFELLSASYPHIKYKLLEVLLGQISSRIKQVHNKIIHCIRHSDMASLSFFGKVINTFNQPKAVNFEEVQIDKGQLSKIPLFKLFEKKESLELINRMELLEASKHCKLIHEGEKTASCYIVVRGAVQSSIMQDNRLAKLSVIGPGLLFASVACIDSNSSYTISFSSCEQAILLKMPHAILKFFQNEKPSLWYKLYHLICISLVALEKSMDKLDIRLHIETYNR